VDPALLVSFCGWMRQQRGTCDATLYNYSLHLRDLLKSLGEDPDKFDAHNLRRLILDTSQRCGWAAAKKCTTAVRMFLRFLIASGKCAAGLDASVPVLAHWRLSSLPRYLQSDEGERVIASCDTATPAGRRDRAILLLLARLGLRAGGLVQLRLGDIDWKGSWDLRFREGATSDNDAVDAGDWRCDRQLHQGRSSSDRRGCSVYSIPSTLSISREPLCNRDDRCPGHAPGWWRLPEPWCSPCPPPFGSKLDAPARCLVAGDRGCAPAAFHGFHGDLRQSRCRHPATDYAALARGEIMLTQAVRRATGFAFRSEGSLLQSFAAFSDAARKHYISSETAIKWAGSAQSLTQRARRLGPVIRFARYIRAEDPHRELPPTVYGSETRPRPVPYIFSADTIQRLLQAASEMVNAIPFAGTPTIHSSPCWRVPGFACRKQSISVFRTSPQTAGSFAVQSSAKAGSFPFTRPHRPAWDSTSCGGALIPHWMITCSFPCGGARCCCMTPKPHSTTSSRRLASLVDRDFHAPQSIPFATRSQ